VRLFHPENVSQTKAIVAWVNERLENTVSDHEAFAVAVIEEGTFNILAGAVFTGYSGENMFLSGAIDPEGIGKVTRGHLFGMLMTAFGEPFNCLRITSLVAPKNERSKRFVTGLGFKQEGALRDYLEEDTETLLYGLTRKEFLGGRYGRRQRREWRRAS